LPGNLLAFAEQVDRAAEHGFRHAAAIGVEEIDALRFGEHLAANNASRHGRTVEETRPDGDVARLRQRRIRRRKQAHVFDAVIAERVGCAERRRAHLRLAARAQIRGQLARVVAPFDV